MFISSTNRPPALSSKDSEHVIEIIRGMAHNKIVIVTIHQPSSKIFQMFHKAILLDKGGRLVFFGTPTDMLRYFAEAEHQHQFGADLGACPSCGTTRPEFIFDVLETPSAILAATSFTRKTIAAS